MPTLRFASIAALTLAILLPATASATHGPSSTDLRAFGLTANGRLVRFHVDNPRGFRIVGTIDGFVLDTRLIGIDFRPANGKLYGVGDKGGIYIIDTSDGDAAKVSQLTIALVGNSFGVDFNPAADALRIVSDAGQNLRHPFASGVTEMDGALNYAGSPPATTAGGVAAAAYTNNDADPNTGTILYNIDTMLDQAVVQAPPNSGTLNVVGKLTVDTSAIAGFDIYTVLVDGKATKLRGFASLSVGGSSRLFGINLATGRATDRGRFGRITVVDIALPLAQM